MYIVRSLLQKNGETVGAVLMSHDGLSQIQKAEFPDYKDKLIGVTVEPDGSLKATKGYLSVRDISGVSENEILYKPKVSKYTIMYTDKPVLLYDSKADEVTVYNKDLLPFGLRSLEQVTSMPVYKWLSDRISNINREYMEKVYIARMVGRDKDRVLSDSAGVSFTDKFWIKTSDVSATWDELESQRDTNESLSPVALTGKIDADTDYLSGHTSLFTTKGYFRKAIQGGYIIKMREDAELEYPASLLGRQLGISVVECELTDETVKIKIFTDSTKSLVHAAELKQYYGDEDEIYNHIKKINRPDLLSQLQRMYIFNYIIGNFDLHDENTGLLYDPETFEFISVSPCYDHNVAFREGFNGVARNTKGGTSQIELDKLTQLFIPRHPDITERLKELDYTEIEKYLSLRQASELKERVQQVLSWS